MTTAQETVRPPIPLADPTGKVFAYACGYCLQVSIPGRLMAGQQEPDERHLAWLRESTERCCACWDCGKRGNDICTRCADCDAKSREAQRPQVEAWQAAQKDDRSSFAFMLRERLRTWDPAEPKPYPLTITHGRDGIGFIALPLPLDEMPQEIAERCEGWQWWVDSDATLIGHGDTPEASLADLREKARAVREVTP